MPIIEQWHRAVSCCDPAWEEAYQRFESPDEEIARFRRLPRLGWGVWVAAPRAGLLQGDPDRGTQS